MQNCYIAYYIASILTCFFALNCVYFHWEPSPSNKSEFTVIGERSQFSQTAQPKGGGGRLVRL